MKCNICGQESTEFAHARLIDKYDICYFRCATCGFIQTEAPYWIEEVYAQVINNADVGLVARNMWTSYVTNSIIRMCFRSNGKFLDYGGGYGLFVRMMRDRGFDFFRFDPFCENIFAKNFDADVSSLGVYELVTAFEVFEHLTVPIDGIADILRFSDNILFSTMLIPDNNPMPGEWWYYGLEHGQHVSLYSYKSLEVIARRFGLHLCSNRRDIHLLTKKKTNKTRFDIASNIITVKLLGIFSGKQSLLREDYFKLTGKRTI